MSDGEQPDLPQVSEHSEVGIPTTSTSTPAGSTVVASAARTTRGSVGWLRTALVGLAGAAVVVAAAKVPGSATVGGASAATRPAAASTSPATSMRSTCPGPETEGVANVSSSAGSTKVTAVAPPQSVLTRALTVAGAGAQTTPAPTSGAASAQATAAPSTPAPAPAVSIVPLGGPGAATAPLATGAARTPIAAAVTGALAAEVVGVGALAPGVAAVQTWQREDGDLRGFAATPCAPATADAWLVAGGGQSTRRERLDLVNPGANTVSVEVTVAGAKGPVVSPNGHNVSVPPQGRTVLLLDALVASEPSPVVHVVATGGAVAATLADSWVDGAVGRGADDAAPSSAPATEQVVPVGDLGSGPASIRIANTAADETVAQVRALTTSGPVALPDGGVQRIGAGTSVDIDLSGLPAGTYALQVRADRPVVAGVMLERRTADPASPSDLAWATASSPVTTLAGAPVPAGTTGRLTLVSTGSDVTATVTTVDAAGTPTDHQVSVPADSTAALDLAGAASVWIARPGSADASAGQLRAALTLTSAAAGTPLFSVVPLEPLTVTSTSLPVVLQH